MSERVHEPEPEPPKGLELTDEFRGALRRLRKGDNIFLTGKAGTGKSTLIRHFLATTDRNSLVVAPTGIAALNVEGYTIHRLLGLGPGATLEYVTSSTYYPGRYGKVIEKLETLVVDEVSMVRADLFDILETVLRRFGPRRGYPFGGVQIVLVGDLFQLPPVVQESEKSYFESIYQTPYFFSSSAYVHGRFETVDLTKVFRQAGDFELTEILNGIREGRIGEVERSHLNTRTQHDFEAPSDEFWLTLATTNRIVNSHNNRRLNMLPGQLYESHARIEGEVEDADLRADLYLAYKVGAQVMMLTNDQGFQWVNGTLGQITRVEFDEDGDPCVTIVTQRGREFTVGLHVWEILRPSVSGGRLVSEVVGTVTQLPFKLAWAITIHKSQGQTLERLVVDLTGGTFAYGQLYVALSRAVTLDGLVLKRDVIPKDLKTDQRVRRFLSGETPVESAPHSYLAMSFVGNEGHQYRPRPIEIAVVHEDGRSIETLVNPQCDLYDARLKYGISTSDILAAPTLAEAWPAILDLLDGTTPVGINIDEMLSYVDFELKRNGYVESMPLGINFEADLIPEVGNLASKFALDRARALQRAASKFPPVEAGTVFRSSQRPGFLLARHEPIEDVRVGGADYDGYRREVIDDLYRRSGASETVTGSELDLILRPGARVCFTGTVIDAQGRPRSRAEMEELARDCELEPVANVSKTRCDVLVVAEVGSQSGKAKKAMQWGKPVIAAGDFLSWAEASPF